MTPNQLAAKLVGPENADAYGKRFVRPLLRKTFPRDPSLKGSGWTLDELQIATVTAAHKARVEGKAFDPAAFAAEKRKRSRS